MKKIERYLIRHIINGIVLVLCILLFLNVFFVFLGEVARFKENYHLLSGLYYVILSVPNMLVQLLPFAILIGCIFGLSTLTRYNEMIIIQVTGFSFYRIFFVALKPVLVIFLIGMAISEFVVPQLQVYAESMREEKRLSDKKLVDESIWWRDNDKYIHVFKINEHDLEKINIFIIQSNQLKQSIYAEKATYLNKKWQLENVSITSYQDGKKMEHYKKNVMLWDINMDLEVLKISRVSPFILSLYQLSVFMKYLKGQQASYMTYALAFYSKIFSPLNIAALLLIGMSFVFGSLRLISVEHRLLMGISTSFFILFLQKFLNSISMIFGLPPSIMALLPTVICFLVGVYLTNRKAVTRK